MRRSLSSPSASLRALVTPSQRKTHPGVPGVLWTVVKRDFSDGLLGSPSFGCLLPRAVERPQSYYGAAVRGGQSGPCLQAEVRS